MQHINVQFFLSFSPSPTTAHSIPLFCLLHLRPFNIASDEEEPTSAGKLPILQWLVFLFISLTMENWPQYLSIHLAIGWSYCSLYSIHKWCLSQGWWYTPLIPALRSLIEDIMSSRAKCPSEQIPSQPGLHIMIV